MGYSTAVLKYTHVFVLPYNNNNTNNNNNNTNNNNNNNDDKCMHIRLYLKLNYFLDM